MSQARRLLELYDRLQLGQRLDNATIRADYGITRRQATRDLALLDDVLGGRMVRLREGGGKAWWFLEDGEHRRAVSVKQVFAVAVGTRLAGFLAGQTFEPETSGILASLVRRLRGAQQGDPVALLERIHVVSTGQKRYRERAGPQAALQALVDGLLLDLEVELAYLSPRRARAGAPPRQLRVAPLSLVLYRSAVYVVVEVCGGEWRGAPRILLALDRVVSARCTQRRFLRPVGFSAAAFLSEAFAIDTRGPLQEVVLRVSARLATHVEERFWHASARQRRCEDGRLELALKVRGDEVLELVRSMGQEVELVSPPALRRRLREELWATLQQYGH
jgi:predicted DNA-binding transcriptional regulator YafY